MIINLFSVFDPSSSLGFNFNWLSLLIVFLLFPMSKWSLNSRGLEIFRIISKKLNKEIKPIFSLKRKISLVVFIALFFLILFNNLIGLVPYIFTATRHLVVTLRLALPLWMGYFRFGWVINIKWILAHLVPQGTPTLLIPFIVLIETVRSLIRPITLSVRLIANIIAGHLLLSLVRNSIPIFSIKFIVGIVFIQILLVVLEVAVAIIQSYVLVVLRILYVREV